MPSGSSRLGDMWGRLKATCDGQKKCTREATQNQKISGTQKMFALVGESIRIMVDYRMRK